MKFNKSLKGFTLTEVIVTMVISGILIAFLFLFYSNTSRYIYTLIEKKQTFSEILRLQIVLENDSRKCNVIKSESDSILLLENDTTFFKDQTSNFTPQTSKIRYIISSKKIIRIKSDFIDTFHVGVNYFSFRNNCFDTDADVLPANEILIGIKTSSFQDTICVVKRYSAEELIWIENKESGEVY